MLDLGHIVRISIIVGLLLSISPTAAYSQSSDKSKAEESIAGSAFSAPETIYPFPAWALSAALAQEDEMQNDTSILSQFDPLWQENLVSGKFEQVQSIIIPGGIIDVVNNLVYLVNGTNDIVVLDIKKGKTIRRIDYVCCPLAVVDNNLLALSRTKDDAPAKYDLLMLDSTNLHSKARWGTISLPDWLMLPADGERQKFIFNVHCYNNVLSVAWQASRRQMFPNPLSLIIPAMAQPAALQGNFNCDLKSQTIISQSMQEGDADFLGYLTANENLPEQIILDSDTIAIRKYNYYLFSLVRSYPPEHNISSAGVVAKLELCVKDMRTGKILWSHILPATFMPLAI
jgi:hypothetical protein